MTDAPASKPVDVNREARAIIDAYEGASFITLAEHMEALANIEGMKPAWVKVYRTAGEMARKRAERT